MPSPLAALLAEVRGLAEKAKAWRRAEVAKAAESLGLAGGDPIALDEAEARALRDLRVAVDAFDLPRLLALVEPGAPATGAADAAIQRAVEAEREACALAICPLCDGDDNRYFTAPVVGVERFHGAPPLGQWIHERIDGRRYLWTACRANAIRQRAAAPTEGRPSPPPDAQDRTREIARAAAMKCHHGVALGVEGAMCVNCATEAFAAALAQAEAKYQGQVAATERVRETAAKWQRAYQDELDASTRLRAELAALAQARGAGE